jgi:glutamyl-tRNA reductase
MRVSVMLDANGANTTASAAVVAAGRHLDLSRASAAVLAATGPVGQRVCKLLAAAGASVKVGSRDLARAESVCQRIAHDIDGANLAAVAPTNDDQLRAILDDADVLVAAGTTGVRLASESAWSGSQALKVAIDLNAVPPLGIEAIGVADAAAQRNGVICYGAVGIGGTKMKIHKAAIRQLFMQNDLVLDAAEIYRIGCEIERSD